MREMKRHRAQNHPKYFCSVCDEHSFGYVTFSGYTHLREHLRKEHQVYSQTEEERISCCLMEEPQKQLSYRARHVAQPIRKQRPVFVRSVETVTRPMPRMVSDNVAVYRPRNRSHRGQYRGNDYRSIVRGGRRQTNPQYVLVPREELNAPDESMLQRDPRLRDPRLREPEPYSDVEEMLVDDDNMSLNRGQSGSTFSVAMMEMVTKGRSVNLLICGRMIKH